MVETSSSRRDLVAGFVGPSRLNYHHLYYFFLVAREETIARAAAIAHVSQPTISEQLRLLEDALGERLFDRAGRRLRLTDAGRITYEYASEIFRTGRELVDTLGGHITAAGPRVRVGVSDVVPKLIAARLLEPALRLMQVRLSCTEGHTSTLLAALATHELDLVIADEPLTSAWSIKGFNHLLGECGTTFFATRAIRRRLDGRFPRSLNGAPAILPAESTTLRRAIDAWLDEEGLRVDVVAEVQDSGLAKALGQRGVGVFTGPTAIEHEIRSRYDVTILGRAPNIRDRFFAITVERRIRHPFVAKLSELAQAGLFA